MQEARDELDRKIGRDGAAEEVRCKTAVGGELIRVASLNAMLNFLGPMLDTTTHLEHSSSSSERKRKAFC